MHDFQFFGKLWWFLVTLKIIVCSVKCEVKLFMCICTRWISLQSNLDYLLCMLQAIVFFSFSPTTGQRNPGQEAPSYPFTICHATGAARISPPQSLQAAALLKPPLSSHEHLAPSVREKQPVKADLCSIAASTGKQDNACISILYTVCTPCLWAC